MYISLRRLAAPLLLCVVYNSNPVSAEVIEGFTEPYRTVDVSIGEPGVVQSVGVVPGQNVREGDPLVSLDTSVLEATLQVAKKKAESQGTYDSARAELQLREERLNQILLLRQRGHATQREFTRANADVEIARARVRAATEEQAISKLDCKRIQAQLARRRVSSPFTGVIAEVHREVGESIMVTDPRVVTLVQLDRLRTRFSATPHQASQLRIGQNVKVKLGDATEKLSAKVERISPVVDAKSGTVEVHVVLDNARRELRSGIRCLLEVDGPDTSDDSLALTK